MQPGEKVVVIIHSYNYWCGMNPSPPVGAIGVVVEGEDSDGELYVFFADHLCPSVDKPWFIHKTHVVPMRGRSQKVICRSNQEVT